MNAQGLKHCMVACPTGQVTFQPGYLLIFLSVYISFYKADIDIGWTLRKFYWAYTNF